MIVLKLRDFAIVAFFVLITYLIAYLLINIIFDLSQPFDSFIVPALSLAVTVLLLIRISLYIIITYTRKYVLFEVSSVDFGLREKYGSKNKVIKYKKSDLKEVVISTADLFISIDLIFKDGTAEFLVAYLPKYFAQFFGKKDIDKVVNECKLLFGKKIVKVEAE